VGVALGKLVRFTQIRLIDLGVVLDFARLHQARIDS
jgi:hypothetical protein